MTPDSRIIQAINEAVEEARQPAALGRRLVAWFEAVTSGNEEINDDAAAERHLNVLFEGVVVEDLEDQEGGDS